MPTKYFAVSCLFPAVLLAVASLAQDSPPTGSAVSQTQPAATQSSTDDALGNVQNVRQILGIDELRFDFQLEGSFDEREVRYERERRFAGGTERQINRARRFEESLGVETSGWLYREDAFQFDIAARWGLSQEKYVERWIGRDRVERPDGNLLEYDIHAILFPRGQISLTASASQSDSRIPRAFLPSLERERDRYEVSLLWNDPTLPSRITFEHLDDQLSSFTRSLDDDEQRRRDRFHYETTWQISPLQELRWEYEYTDRREEYSGSDTRFDTNRHFLMLQHVLRFGPEQRSVWNTELRVQEEKGDLARDQLELQTRLRLQHTDALSSFYQAQLLKESYQGFSTDTYRGEIGLTHQLGDALTTTAQVYGLRHQAERNTDFTEWGTLLSSSYARDNDWGRFSANASYSFNNIDTSSGRRTGVILKESVTFRDPLPSYLAQTYVRRWTILVTDANRTRTYLPGRDYLIVPLGRYTALVRMPTGQIADRETVLVTYTYRVHSDYDISRHRVDWRVQQDFEWGLSPYYAGNVQGESLDRQRFLRFEERDIQRHRLGATFRQPRWSVGAEYEYNDDDIDPYQAVHLTGDAVLLQRFNQQLDAKAAFSQFWFEGRRRRGNLLRERDTALFDAGLSYRAWLNRQVELKSAALFRYEDDSAYGITHGFDLTAGLEWRIGFFTLEFDAEYDVLELPGSRDDGLSVWLRLRREFPVVRRTRS